MNDAERAKQTAMLLSEAAKLNEELEGQAAIDRCDKCPNPKQEYVRELALPNGVRLSLCSVRCASPGLECTAPVSSHLLSESPLVANRIIESMAEQPELERIGVTWWTCGEARHVLTFPTPAEANVVSAVGEVAVGEFRKSR